MSNIRIALTGGGTGGHVFPLIAVNQALRKIAKNNSLNLDVHYFGPHSNYWNILALQGIAINRIAGTKFRRYFDLRNVLDVFKFPWSLVQAFWKMFWFMPDALFSKGGSGSLSIVLAAAFYRIPIIIHESDSYPSLTTALSVKYALRIAISFEETAKYLTRYSDKIALVGNPVREVFLTKGDYDKALLKKELGFDSELPVVLFLGGSQGAEIINDFIVDNLETLLQRFQIIHQAGVLNYKNVLEATKNTPSNRYLVYGLLDQKDGSGEELKRMFLASDIIVSRAGSGAIFEIAAMGVPSILIPLESSASRHQTINAYQYSQTGAASIIEEENFLPHLIMNEIEGIFNNKEKMIKMNEAALKFAKPEAAGIMAKEILNLAQKS